MKILAKFVFILTACLGLSGCLVTTVVGAAVGTAVGVVDAVTPNILD